MPESVSVYVATSARCSQRLAHKPSKPAKNFFCFSFPPSETTGSNSFKPLTVEAKKHNDFTPSEAILVQFKFSPQKTMGQVKIKTAQEGKTDQTWLRRTNQPMPK